MNFKRWNLIIMRPVDSNLLSQARTYTTAAVPDRNVNCLADDFWWNTPATPQKNSLQQRGATLIPQALM